MAEQARTGAGAREIPDEGQAASVALARDDRYCVAAAGAGVQGVGLDVVVSRSEEEWRELIGEADRDLLAELAGTEPLDRAGARVRAARECLAKASAPGTSRPEVFRRAGDAVVVRARAASGGDLHVLTVPVTFTLGPERMLATLVEPEPPAPQDGPEGPGGGDAGAGTPHDEDLGYRRGAYELATDTATRQFVLRWPLAFKECANLDRTVYFTSYAEWMGRVRETAMVPIAEPLAEQMATGRWGMVTNSSGLRVVGEPRPGDVIEARCAVYPSPAQPESAIDLDFEWRRLPAGSRPELVALGQMRTTWVELVGHGQVRPAEMPGYFREFVQVRTPPAGRPQAPARPAGPAVGAARYRRAEGPARGPVIGSRTFDTCLQESNLVGNIYFSNYYVWQARLVETYVQPLVPDRYRTWGPEGGLRCVQARVEHLVDAMPFEDIDVVATLEAVHERAVTFTFEYYRRRPDGKPQKLAHGSQQCVWFTGRPGNCRPAPLPPSLSDDLMARVDARDSEEEASP